jgi:hypothetical protein
VLLVPWYDVVCYATHAKGERPSAIMLCKQGTTTYCSACFGCLIRCHGQLALLGMATAEKGQVRQWHVLLAVIAAWPPPAIGGWSAATWATSLLLVAACSVQAGSAQQAQLCVPLCTFPPTMPLGPTQAPGCWVWSALQELVKQCCVLLLRRQAWWALLLLLPLLLGLETGRLEQ